MGTSFLAHPRILEAMDGRFLEFYIKNSSSHTFQSASDKDEQVCINFHHESDSRLFVQKVRNGLFYLCKRDDRHPEKQMTVIIMMKTTSSSNAGTSPGSSLAYTAVSVFVAILLERKCIHTELLF